MKKTAGFILLSALMLLTMTARPAAAQKFDKSAPDLRVGPPVERARGGPDSFGYAWIDNDEPGGPVFGWIDITVSGINTGIAVDDRAVLVDIGFGFGFYGQIFGQVMIGENGTLSFINYGGSHFFNEPIPSTNAPNSLIAPFWDDHYTPAGGAIYYETRGTSPNRTFIVEWFQVPHISDQINSRFTYQVILSEASQAIKFQYLSMTGIFGNGSSATVGIENQTGTEGLQVSFNTPYVHDGLAIRIAVPPQVAFTFASSSGDESNSPVNFAVSQSAVSESDVTVDYAVTGGTAIGGGMDYILAAGTATILAGQTTTNITASVVDDIMTEPDETIIVTLSNPINATLGTNTTHTYTILDNDPLVEWELQLTAADSSLGIYDTENFAGISSAATDTFDAGFDVPEPPHAPSQYISLYIPHPEWNHLLGDNFSQDIRANANLSDAFLVWNIAVDNDMSFLLNDILTLNIVPQAVPPGLNIVLRDLETGIPPFTQDMRANPVYSYTASNINVHDHPTTDATTLASGSVHHFQLAVGDSTPPSVAVTAPNGGEAIEAGSTFTITWTASDGSGIDFFGIAYSSDAGSTFTDIDIVPGDQRSYLWNVPIILTDQALIKIRARDNMGNFGFDQSDGLFTIADTTPPLVAVTAPNGGEILLDSTFTITWTASDTSGLAGFELFYSTDAGSIYTIIDTVGGGLRSYLWNVPLVTTERALIKVRATDIVGNFAADVSNGLFTIISRTQSHTFNAGWNLISVPLIPENAFADAVIGDDVPPASYYYLFGYQAGTGYVLSDSVFLSEGYWLATVDTVNVDVQGTPVAQTQTVPLAGGWNLIGNPFVGSVLKSAAEVQLGATTLGFQAAVDTGWISPVLYTYAAGNAGYSQKDTLDPWSGYWFGTLVEGLNLLINPIGPPLAETTKPAETTKSLAKQVVSSAAWQVTVAARSDGVADLISAFGVNESATNGFDAAFDEPEPPLPPAGDVIRLYFPHPEWGVILGDKFNQDIQAPLGENETRSWTFEVQRVGSVEPSELSWDAITVENHIFALTDLDAQETIDMTEQTSYSYTGDDLIRHFQIEVTNTTVVSVGDGEETLPTTYDLSQNYPNPFNPATTIRIDLPEAAAVRLVVYDLQGREVATLVTGDRRAGYHSVVWDGKATIGGEAPSGIYIARLVTPSYTKSIKMVLLK